MMNAIGAYKTNTSSPFKTPLIPLRRGRKAIKNRLEINHHNYNSSSKDFKSIILTNKQKSNHSTSSKSLNKRKTFRYTPPFQSKNLVVTPAVSMLYNTSKRKRIIDHEDEVISLAKRRKLDVISAKTFLVESITDEPKLKEILQYFDDNQVARVEVPRKPVNIRSVETKIPDQNENVLSFPEGFKDHKVIQPLVTSTKCSNTEHSSNKKLNGAINEADQNGSGIKVNKTILREPVTTNVDSLKKHNNLTESMVVIIQPVDAKVKTEIKNENVDITEIDEFSFDEEPTIDVKLEIVNTNVTSSNHTHSNAYYAGQLLWARYLKYPYWPSIVCPSENGAITQDTNHLVHVKFCANKGTTGWVKMNHVFEFNGMESFIEAKKTMKSTLSRYDYKAGFTKTNKAWSRAVVEGTFILSKDMELRLAFFEVIVICSLRENQKNPKSLMELVSEHSSPSQLTAVKKLLGDNPDIYEDIKHEFNQIAPDIHLTPTKTPRQATPPSTLTNEHRRHSAPQVLTSTLQKRRSSVRIASVVQNQLSVSTNDLSLSKDQAAKEEKVQREQKKSYDIKQRREQKRIEFEKDLKLYDMKSYPKNILFQGVRRGNVCKICLSLNDKNDSDLVKCSGACGDYVHTKCVHSTTIKKNGLLNIANILICNECIDLSSPVCYACKKTCSTESKLVRCSHKSCGRYYHIKCLDDWLQTKFIESDKVLCPSHVCHTCVSDDPRNKHYSTANSKLTRCVKCPTTFDINSCCIPAGIHILTQTQHICIRHRTEFRKPVNLNWCYICGERGGMLLCCESCPQTCHMSCLQLTVAPEHYFCDSCETGRHPLYGEIVWAKFSAHRWWPAIVVPPFCIPDFLEEKPHHEHDLCVRFFGSYEFCWIGRTFVYLYDKGDANSSFTGEPKYDEALVQAENWFHKLNENMKSSSEEILHSEREKLIPKPFHKISNIKPLPPARLIKKESESQPCTCDPDEDDPCGPTSGCTNRACLTECDAKLCQTGSKCNNQSIEKKIYANFKLEYMGEKGFGLISTKPIRCGTFIIEYVGELVTENEFKLRLSTKQTQNFYFMKYDKGLYIDAELKGNMSRFMNHSCNPNCEPQRWSVNGVDRIGLFAVMDIPEGTELTFNYEFDDDTHRCFCGEHNCTGIIGRRMG